MGNGGRGHGGLKPTYIDFGLGLLRDQFLTAFLPQNSFYSFAEKSEPYEHV